MMRERDLFGNIDLLCLCICIITGLYLCLLLLDDRKFDYVHNEEKKSFLLGKYFNGSNHVANLCYVKGNYKY